MALQEYTPAELVARAIIYEGCTNKWSKCRVKIHDSVLGGIVHYGKFRINFEGTTIQFKTKKPYKITTSYYLQANRTISAEFNY